MYSSFKIKSAWHKATHEKYMTLNATTQFKYSLHYNNAKKPCIFTKRVKKYIVEHRDINI